MCQAGEILVHMLKGESITPLQALRKFSCMRLSARILDLRRLGYEIKAELVKRGKKHYCRYSIGGC